MTVRPTQRANGPTARLRRVATKKEKINRLSCAPPEPPCWKPRAPRCLVELVHSRHTRFPKEARAGGGGQYSTVPYVAALRGNNRVRKHLCPTIYSALAKSNIQVATRLNCAAAYPPRCLHLLPSRQIVGLALAVAGILHQREVLAVFDLPLVPTANDITNTEITQKRYLKQMRFLFLTQKWSPLRNDSNPEPILNTLHVSGLRRNSAYQMPYPKLFVSLGSLFKKRVAYTRQPI